MKTTSKEVTTKLQAHILEQFGTDYGWSDDNQIANLTEQIVSMRVRNENNYQIAVCCMLLIIKIRMGGFKFKGTKA